MKARTIGGVRYTGEERKYLAGLNLSAADEWALHKVKEVFCGEIITCEPPVIDDWLTAMGNTLPQPKGVSHGTGSES